MSKWCKLGELQIWEKVLLKYGGGEKSGSTKAVYPDRHMKTGPRPSRKINNNKRGEGS